MSSKVVRVVRESLPTHPQNFDRNRRRRSAGPAAFAGTALYQESRDGTQTIVPNPPAETTYLGNLIPVQPATQIDAFAAMQMAVRSVLQTMTFYSLNLEAIGDGQGTEVSQPMRVGRVIFDWPRQEDDFGVSELADPTQRGSPTALVMSEERQTYDRQDLSTYLIEDSEGVYGENTVLRKLANLTSTMHVQIICAHKEVRRGVRAALERAFLVELDDNRQGRRVVVPQYYDRICRINLDSVQYVDGSDSAQSNQFLLSAFMPCDIDVVDLVTIPGRIRETQFSVDT